MLAPIALALHVLAAVVWVGGMFLVYVCLRPSVGGIEPAVRCKLMRDTLRRFFIWVWAAVVLILLTGYWMIFSVYDGFAGLPLYINLMQAIGLVMVGLYFFVFHGPWLKYKRAVDAADYAAAAGHMNVIRRIVAINLPLGLLVVAIAAGGRWL